MDKRILKSFVVVFVIALFFLVATIINVKLIKKNVNSEETLYKNELSRNILNNNIENVDYNYLLNDLNELDNTIKDQLKLDVDIKKKTEYYKLAQNIYDNKINEIVRILNDKLDDEDFEILQLDIEEFYKNIDFALDEIKATNKSSIDVTYNSNKYMYEEKQGKCHEIIDNYKGFLRGNKL